MGKASGSGQSRMRSLLISGALLVLFGTGCWSGVSGTIVDQYGNPISDVSFRLGHSVATSLIDIDSYGGESSHVVRSGRLSATCWKCTAFHLFFYKEGYYSESRDLAIFEWKHGLEIVMHRAENPVKLIEHQSHLEAGPDVDDMAMLIEPFGTRETPLAELEAVRNAKPYIVLRPSLDQDGTLAMMKGEPFDSPGPAVLDFSSAGLRAGVQPYEPTTRYVDRAYREMRIAPSDGYETSLVLEPGRDEQFFYCRIPRQSCKGRVTAPRIRHKRGGKLALELSVELYLSSATNELSLDDPSKF